MIAALHRRIAVIILLRSPVRIFSCVRCQRSDFMQRSLSLPGGRLAVVFQRLPLLAYEIHPDERHPARLRDNAVINLDVSASTFVTVSTSRTVHAGDAHRTDREKAFSAIDSGALRFLQIGAGAVFLARDAYSGIGCCKTIAKHLERWSRSRCSTDARVIARVLVEAAFDLAPPSQRLRAISLLQAPGAHLSSLR